MLCEGVHQLCRLHLPGPPLRERVMGSPGSPGPQYHHKLEVSDTWAFRGPRRHWLPRVCVPVWKQRCLTSVDTNSHRALSKIVLLIIFLFGIEVHGDVTLITSLFEQSE